MHDDFKAAKDFFNNMAQNWDSTFTPDPEKIKLITSLCPISDKAEIIDIACGTGALFPALLSAGPSKILGVDISEKMLEEASKKFLDPRIKLLCANFFDVEETRFDRAFIYRAYPHFHDKTAFIKHLHHILKDGGRFIIAHTESRKTINSRHQKTAADVSDILSDVETESKLFADFFDIDIKADTDFLYIISGTKRAL